jgi:hypothetical protein
MRIQRQRVTWSLVAALAFGGAGCTNPNVHDTADAKTKPCVQCHISAYQAANAPLHADTFPQTCNLCHVTQHWSPSTFTHAWPLENKHADVACASCHVGNQPDYRAAPTLCAGCHQKDYDGATSPVHGGMPTTCSDCHTTAGWKPSNFLHTWPLDGVHATTSCASCHSGNPPQYANTASTCDACHHADYQRSTFPGHQTFPVTCADCHRTSGFSPALPPGHPEDAFPVTTGKHATATITCLTCHRLDNGPATGGQNTDCIHCHLGEHQRPAIDAVHGHGDNAAYPTNTNSVNFCLTCHSSGQL